MLDWDTLVHLGDVVMTLGVAKKIPVTDVCMALTRHAMCDWGELGDFDRKQNDSAHVTGGRLLSRYTASNGKVFWIITEADRSSTTLLLPNEY